MHKGLLSLLAVLTLAACGGQAQPAGQAGSGAARSGAPRWGMNAEQQAAWDQIEAAANKEGSVTVYALTTLTPEQLPRLQELWKKDYPGIKIDLTTGRPVDVTTKVSTEFDAKAHVADVAQLGGSTGRQLDRMGALEPFNPPAVQDPSVKWRINPLQDEAQRGTNLAGTLSYVPIWINSQLVKPEDEPHTHLDVTDPKWKGKIVWDVPWSAGYGWNEYYLGKKTYGMDWVTKMQAQNVSFSPDTNNGPNVIARGEDSILLANLGSDTAVRLIHDGQPLKAIWPDDFTYGSANGFDVIKSAPHPNAAKVFVNWWFSQAGQQFYNDLGQWPNRSDLQPKEDWMKGFAHPKTYWYPTPADDALSAPMQKEAATYLKK
jgi:ABC-type Fe3+ transport system substrate-binding protein